MIMQIHVLPDPVGTHDDTYRYVDRAIAQIARSGLTYEVGALGTTVEGPADAVWDLARRVHDATKDPSTRRVMTLIKVYESTDATTSMTSLTAPHRPARP